MNLVWTAPLLQHFETLCPRVIASYSDFSSFALQKGQSRSKPPEIAESELRVLVIERFAKSPDEYSSTT
jgi:hypothetical protein